MADEKTYKCSIRNCCSKSDNTEVSFYRLPSNSTLRERWLRLCRLNPTNMGLVRICSLHFKNRDFIQNHALDTPKLVKKAVPCLRIHNNRTDVSLKLKTHKREIRSLLLDNQRRINVKKCLEEFFSQRRVLDFLFDAYNTPSIQRKPDKKLQKIKKLKNIIRLLKKRNEKLNLELCYWKEMSETKRKMLEMYFHVHIIIHVFHCCMLAFYLREKYNTKMPSEGMDVGEGYSPLMGLMYVFNLIVGTGALTMPRPIAEAGWLLSLITLTILAFMSFVTVTFVTESMAAANAIVHSRTVRHLKKLKMEDAHIDENNQQIVDNVLTDEVICNSLENERVPLLLSNAVDTISETSAEYFNITERIEMGKMASLFFKPLGVKVFYFCIAVYLYGDLAIYAAAVSKSMRDVACDKQNGTVNSSLDCWSDYEITRGGAYRLFVIFFLVLLGPFTFFNVQKTKYLQIFTSFMRWIAFSIMIILASIKLGKGEGEGHPTIADYRKIPNLFGVCVYSFMCHHSLPSLVTPIQNKSKLLRLFIIDYVLILVFYSLLSFTGIFAFDNIESLYTLNFEPTSGESIIPKKLAFLQYFLALFPVFTLSTNFPIIAITLRNNLKSIFLHDNRSYSYFVGKILFPLLAIVPPVAIALITEDLSLLVGVTGSYAGAAIQYVVPAMLVYYSREHILQTLGVGVTNRHASPFRHSFWILFVMIWSILCITFVSINYLSLLVK